MPAAAVPTPSPAWRSMLPIVRAMACLLVVVLTLVGAALVDSTPVDATQRASTREDFGTPAGTYRCDGDPLTALLIRGAMDDPAMADPSSGDVPVGGFVVLRWRDLSLQLPRTNNAGPASFTDGQWWWSLDASGQPDFRLRRGRGNIQSFACEAPL